MGIGFVIFLHLIAIFILSAIISIVVGLLTYFLSNKEKRKQKVFAAILSPFFGLYTFYFVGLFGSIVVSETKNVAIGIGDSFYVPLIDNCELRFSDSPEYAYIENNGQQIIRDISKISQVDYQIFGKTKDDEYFSYDVSKNELKKFKDENALTFENSNRKLELIRIDVFYSDRRNEVAGFSLVIVGLISLMVSVTIIYMLKKLIVGYLNFR
jgi:hypothetical protein